MSRSDAVNPPRQALLQEAADWLVRLDTGELSQTEQQALRHWCQSSPEHERVWQAACELNRRFAHLPGALAKPVLGRQRVNRRAVLKSLAGAGLLLPLGWMAARHQPWQPMLVDQRSAPGERRSVTLADGSELTLNTDTALDVSFDTARRRLQLYQGEVFVHTGKDQDKVPVRPFSVSTAQGDIQALGTEFAVRCLPDATQVTVIRNAVMVSPRSGATPQRVEAGEQCLFTPNAVKSIHSANPDSLAWRRGELIVDNWRLDDFVQELARYRPGLLRCDSRVASLKVSGVFQTDNTDQALEALVQVHNLNVTRFTDYWVSIGTTDTG